MVSSIHIKKPNEKKNVNAIYTKVINLWNKMCIEKALRTKERNRRDEMLLGPGHTQIVKKVNAHKNDIIKTFSLLSF